MVKESKAGKSKPKCACSNFTLTLVCILYYTIMCCFSMTGNAIHSLGSNGQVVLFILLLWTLSA